MHISDLIVFLVMAMSPSLHEAEELPQTRPLIEREDLAKKMVLGIDRYLDRLLAEAPRQRTLQWQKIDTAPAAAREAFFQQIRQRLNRILGLVDPRLGPHLEYVASSEKPALVVESEQFKVFQVRWDVLPGLHAEGLLLEPKGKAKASILVIPDADQLPEWLAGLGQGLPPSSQIARRFAEGGARVLIPTLINRNNTYSGSAAANRKTNQTHREFIHRMAYEMGRHLIGYEVQKILAGVDWFCREPEHGPIVVFGYVEGGLLALLAGAIDSRIDITVVSGHFGPHQSIADEPIERNVWTLLRDFGDAELARLIAPRALYLEQGSVNIPAAIDSKREGAAPGQIPSPALSAFQAEVDRIGTATDLHVAVESEAKNRAAAIPGLPTTMDHLLKRLGLTPPGTVKAMPEPALKINPEPRQRRQVEEAIAFTQNLLTPSMERRREVVCSRLEIASLEKFKASQGPLRKQFQEEIIGQLPVSRIPLNPRTRLAYTTARWKGYEVVLDVDTDIIAHGILLIPNSMKPDERRPVIVCQHGLEGRPSDVVDPTRRTQYYNSFGAQLADRGYIVFAPQNPYIFGNQFRQLVRKANPLGLSLYSFIVAQHERILDWLETLPFVDRDRIAFYGLSYGGKVAMRIPAIVTRYCLSICSGDFNEWIWKNINLSWGSSYMFNGEYDMYEYNLGNTFNYAEMAALIAPRPFMVERGHSDGVGLDEYVAFEYARVRRLFAQLGIPERTAIEFFSGGHEIHGQGTFAFLQRHLNWPPTR